MSIFMIAEAGVNHGGDFKRALELAAAAKRSGADAVKYQLFDSMRLWGDDRIKHLELSFAQMRDVAAYCKSIEIEFMCSPFGIEEVEFLAPLVQRMKVASGMIGRKPFLEAVAKTKLPVLLSTGMSTMDEIRAALLTLGHYLPACFGDRSITIMHCTSSYPCKIEDANLRAIESLKWYFHVRCPIGYSDHTQGITVAIAAAAMGVSAIEKHFTLDRTAEGPDHKASIEPEEFRVMVSAIRTVEEALGDGVKRVMDCEKELREVWHGDKR